MKKHTGVIVSSLLTGLLFIGTGFQGAFAAADDAAKLKSLESAVSAPAKDDKGDKKKYKSRAIVFDDPTVAVTPAAPAPAEPQRKSDWDIPAAEQRVEPKPVAAAPPKAPEPRPVAAPTMAKASPGTDCTALPADFSSVTVDFALQFEQGKAEVSPASEPMLREIAKILSLNRAACILVVGHNDAAGNPYLNMNLSHRRASWVVDFIAEKSGMERSRLVPIGMGSSEPLKNLDPRDPKNRRVVFMVVG